MHVLIKMHRSKYRIRHQLVMSSIDRTTSRHSLGDFTELPTFGQRNGDHQFSGARQDIAQSCGEHLISYTRLPEGVSNTAGRSNSLHGPWVISCRRVVATPHPEID